MARKKVLIIVIALGVLSFVFLIAGIIFFVEGSKKSEMKAVGDHCDYSEEARRVGLPNLLQKTQNTYFEMHPERYYNKEGISVQELKRKYKAYDPSPEKIKLRTDIARKLYKEIENTKVNFNAMKQREIKAFFQLKFFVKFVFSTPFGGDYYAGDWMMGPDGLCFHPICNIPNYINNNLQHFKPSTVEEMEEFREKLKEVNQTFFRFIDNLKLGINAGMVETQESCYAGLQAVIPIYENVYRKGEGGKGSYTRCDVTHNREIVCPLVERETINSTSATSRATVARVDTRYDFPFASNVASCVRALSALDREINTDKHSMYHTTQSRLSCDASLDQLISILPDLRESGIQNPQKYGF